MDKLSVLHGSGAGKRWPSDGSKPVNELMGRRFNVELHDVGNIHELAALLEDLEDKGGAFLIRGKPTEKALEAMADGERILRRSKDGWFEDQELHSIMIDVDGWVGADGATDVDSFISAVLGDAWQGATYWWQLSASAGHRLSKGLNAHIWFWSEQAYTSEDLETWASGVRGVDSSVFSVVQPLFVSAPRGRVDWEARKALGEGGLVQGWDGDSVNLEGVVERRVAAVRRLTAVEGGTGRDDHFADWLESEGWVRGRGRDGELYVFCPHGEELNIGDGVEHSSGDGAESSTVYYPAGVGRAEAGFKCLHDTCARRGWGEDVGLFRKWTGYDNAEEDFEVIGERSVGLFDRARAVVASGDSTGMEQMAVEVSKTKGMTTGDKSEVLDILGKELHKRGRLQSGVLMWRRHLMRADAESTLANKLGLADWVRVIGGVDRFVNKGTGEVESFRGMGAKFAPLLRQAEVNGEAVNGGTLERILSEHVFEEAHGFISAPGEDRFFPYRGRRVVNTYTDTSPEARVRADWSEEERRVVQMWEEQMDWMFPDEEDKAVMKKWIRAVVVGVGTQIGWGIHLSGPQGCGKGLLAEYLLTAVMGPSGVAQAHCKDMDGRFNSWATGAPLIVLDEIQTAPTSVDVGEECKKYMTKKTITLERKGFDAAELPHACNYLLTSNDMYRVKLEEGDRRFCVIHVPRSVQECRDHDERMQAIFAAHRETDAEGFCVWGPALRGWVESWDKGEIGSRAPITKDTEKVFSISDTVNLKAWREVIETGAAGVSESLLSSQCLATAGEAVGLTMPIRGAVPRFMSDLGFYPYIRRKSHQSRIHGRIHSLWRTGGATSEDEYEAFREGVREWVPDLF